MQTVRLPIEGMTCQGCVRSLTDVLERIRGVKSVDVSLEERTATVDVQQEIVSAEELAAAVAAAGFSVPSTPVADAPGVSPTSEPLAGGPGDNAADPTGEPAGSGGDAMELSFDVAGMHCASCVDQVERALRSVSGVTDAVVNLATAQARVTWRSATHATDADLQQSVAAAVRAAGYEARPRRVNREHIREMQLDEVRGWRIRWLVATVGLGLLLAPTSWWGFAGADLLRLALATVVMVVSGWPFVRGAIARAIRLSANMDTLVAIGSGAAYVSGVVGWLRGGSTMSLMDGAMILAFLSFGRMLEALAKGRASQAVFRLFDLTPQTAALERGASVERVAVSEVERGDVVIVAPGEKAPLDGVVLAGETEMDESWLTGESMPVEKEIGDTVLAAAINGRGALRLRVTRRCGETALDQIAELVQRTQETRAPVQQLADRVVAWFAPVVVLVAIVTFVTWWFIGDAAFAARAAISVLIVACPCAMGLATPTAVLAATGRGAELGILIKDAQTLQSTAQVDTVLLDKTGTLTSGRPAIVLVEPNSGVESGDCVATAAAAAKAKPAPARRIAILPLHNVRPTNQLNWIGEGASETLTTKLT
ncbi:MAG: HAD-IC family P-type ATPase, partial [Pirellulaceae bacterium]|nr:HAD-IC family P-type ATPase [Pirellulaceae bacterium]